MNFFYFNQNNQKLGPVSEAQLKELAAQGAISPDTPMETDDGHKGTAGQIPGLFATVPPSSTQTPPMTGETDTKQNKNVGGSIVSWLLDFSFRNLQNPARSLLVCKIVYAICCIGGILFGLFLTFSVVTSGYADATDILVWLPFQWLCIVFFIIAARMFCEGYIIVTRLDQKTEK